MRNSAAADMFDGSGDELVGDEGELHELELDVDGWDDETSAGDPIAPATVSPSAPSPATKKAAVAPPAKKAAPAKKSAAKKSAAKRSGKGTR